jgi:hypothetical protein
MKADTLKMLEQLIKRNSGEEDMVAYLTKNTTPVELAEEFVRTYRENMKMKDDRFSVLRISPEDFDRHFRIIGTRSDGEPETRGRKKKEYENL